jgi:predicted RND superfamily exporter protein
MKAKEALYHKFVPVLGAACTTVLACVPAFFTRIKLLRIFAQVISISMMSGAFFSFAFFIPLCSLVGPRADSCEGTQRGTHFLFQLCAQLQLDDLFVL